MPNSTQLRLAAREIFDETLRAVGAGDAVRRTLRLEGSQLNICGTAIDIDTRRVYAIAIGKAANAMASALDLALGGKLAHGIVATNERYDTARLGKTLSAAWQTFESGHPQPNEQSLAAARASIDLLQRANDEHSLVIFLISGGGSAMIEWPINGEITLADLRAANKVLVNCGASIGEVNALRRAFSAVKGGRLAAYAPHCDQITLIISDVATNEEHNVASGPTLGAADDEPRPHEVIARYDLAGQLPPAILRAISAPSTNSGQAVINSTPLREHFVLLDNSSALGAAATAAKRRGLIAKITKDISDQPIEIGCEQLMTRLEELRLVVNDASLDQASLCLISGGEFTCPVRGDGIGGRNLETALRLACSIDSRSSDGEHFAALCAGTDGIDGNSPATGAIIDETTIRRARGIGLDPKDFLNRSDAYSFFVALGDSIATGPTGTNVRDVRILLV